VSEQASYLEEIVRLVREASANWLAAGVVLIPKGREADTDLVACAAGEVDLRLIDEHPCTDAL